MLIEKLRMCMPNEQNILHLVVWCKREDVILAEHILF